MRKNDAALRLPRGAASSISFTIASFALKRRSFLQGAAALAGVTQLEIFAAKVIAQDTWTVRHRRLRTRLAGCTEWDAFDGTCTASPGDQGLTLRGFDLRNGQWTLSRPDDRNGLVFDMPLMSRFENSVGSFFAGDRFEGKAIKVRFLWSRIDTPTPRWAQAFSADGGERWETNWIMDFAPPA